MWSRFTPKGEMSPPPPNVGKTLIFGGAIVLAGLSGFYISMLRNKHKQERYGTNPTYEQVLARVGTRPLVDDEDVNSFPSRSASLRAQPMLPPTKQHNAKHITIEDYKASPGYTDTGRYEVPTPQRAKGDGSGWVYSKSPDYARNYEKTKRRVEKDTMGKVYPKEGEGKRKM